MIAKKSFLKSKNIKGIVLAIIIINKSNKIITNLLLVGLAVHNALNRDFDLIILITLNPKF